MVIDKLVECGIDKDSIRQISRDTLIVQVDREHVDDVIKCLVIDKNAHFSTCLGVDLSGIETSGFSLYYILVLKDKKIVVETKLSSGECVKPVHRAVPAATWCECETMDLLGLKACVGDDIDKYRFILHWGISREIRPLRKTYPYNYKLSRVATCEIERPRDYVEIDPHHPFFYEHEDFLAKVENGKIVDVQYIGSYITRGIEKIGETRLNIDQIPFIAERICGICGFTHSTAYCQAVENALKIEIPERARFERTLMLELERLESHLLILALIAYAIKLREYFVKLLKVREYIMNICEILVGNRKMYGLNIVGGVRFGFTKEQVDKCVKIFEEFKVNARKVLEDFEKCEELNSLKNIGILPKEDAHKLGAVGPVLRASGIDYDVRKYVPYAAYRDVDFEVPVMDSGDTYARAVVRIRESYESIKIVDQIFKRDEIIKGDLKVEYEVSPGKVGVGLTEAPRGENVHFIITGHDMKLYRWKVRAPTYANLAVLRRILIGESIDKAPIIIASLDPCLSCTDRLVMVRV